MKIIYKNSSVYGLVENQTDLDALIKLRDHINGDSNGIRMRKYHKIKARKRHQPWSQADIEYLKSFGKERLETGVLKQMAKHLGRSRGSVRIMRDKVKNQ